MPLRGRPTEITAFPLQNPIPSSVCFLTALGRWRSVAANAGSAAFRHSIRHLPLAIPIKLPAGYWVSRYVPFLALNHHPAILPSFPAIRVRDRHLVIENAGKPCGVRFLTVPDQIGQGAIKVTDSQSPEATQVVLARRSPILAPPSLCRQPQTARDVGIVLFENGYSGVPKEIANQNRRCPRQEKLAGRR